jgi:hypothetical protein
MLSGLRALRVVFGEKPWRSASAITNGLKALPG